jgi:hypothetical protein
MPPPGDVSVPCADAYGLDYNPFPGVADCPVTPEQYDELVEGPPLCDPGFLTSGTGPYSASDINFAARVIFAESSGNCAEDIAMADVIVNRISNPLFSGGSLSTLTAVVSVPGQFNAVTSPGPSGQFIASGPANYENLDPADCSNLENAIFAMAGVVEGGATATYNSFWAASTGHPGTVIGGSVFWTQVPPRPKPRSPRKKQ